MLARRVVFILNKETVLPKVLVMVLQVQPR